LADFDVLLTRTMPAGSLEQITFRLAVLHAVVHARILPVINSPSALEIAIDKFATLQRVSALGFPVPDTAVVQSRGDALDAFKMLGGDCVVKPIFGGEGRGVMRIRDAELAWTTFSTLENLGAVCYVQKFVPPGGSDIRLLVVGDTVRAIRRTNAKDFRTNVSSGGHSEAIEVDEQQTEMAHRICQDIGLRFASVDLLQFDHGPPKVIEVNGIPGWKGAQSVSTDQIAVEIVRELQAQAASPIESACR
jgi:RimK family alpha-L-glutamate ligase